MTPGEATTPATQNIWSDTELSAELTALTPPPSPDSLVVPLRVTTADVEPVIAAQRDAAARRRLLTYGLPATLIAGGLLVMVVGTPWGYVGGGVVLVLQGLGHLVGRLIDRPRVLGITEAPPDSQARTFLKALREPTRAVREIRMRWLVLDPGVADTVVTQEERWDTAGPHQQLEVRWGPVQGGIRSVGWRSRRFRTIVDLTFSDGSALGVVMNRRDLKRLPSQTVS